MKVLRMPKTQVFEVQLGKPENVGGAFAFALSSFINPMCLLGGRLAHIDLGEFLRAGNRTGRKQAMLRLIGTLVEVPPFMPKSKLVM
jgi:hypothetical protein